MNYTKACIDVKCILSLIYGGRGRFALRPCIKVKLRENTKVLAARILFSEQISHRSIFRNIFARLFN